MSYSIFVRDMTQRDGYPPHMLAYDIRSCEEARAIVSGIASSYSDHGTKSDTRIHWFRSGQGVHEIYTWPLS